MKEYFILFLITLFSFSLSSSYDIHILTKGNTEEFTSRDGTFVFDVSSFSLNDEIAIVVHATSFINSKAIAEFFDSMDDYDENGKDNAFQIDSFKTVGETSSTTNYYKIQKSNDFLESLNGNYLFLQFQCNGVVTFKLNKELENSNTNSEYLKKHGSIDVNGSNGGIIMDTKDFNIGDEIYLIINATKFINNKIYYEFVDDLENYTPKSYYEDYDSVEPSKSKYENGKQIKYYTIRKNYGQLSNNIKGNFLIIYFECTGKVTIKNTVENQGKLSTGAIVAIVIVLLIIIVGAIACYCYRRKKSAQIQPGITGEKVVVDNNQNYNNNQYNNNQNYNNAQNYNNNQNYENNQNYDNNQNYNYNQNYNNNQNYGNNQNYNQNYGNNYAQDYNMNSNDQMNAAYYNNGQPQIYGAPDVGYTSKQ